MCAIVNGASESHDPNDKRLWETGRPCPTCRRVFENPLLFKYCPKCMAENPLFDKEYADEKLMATNFMNYDASAAMCGVYHHFPEIIPERADGLHEFCPLCGKQKKK